MNQMNIEKQKELVNLFLSVPTRSQTVEMCEAAVEKNGMNISSVSKRLLSKELCVKAVKQNYKAFLLLSKEYICKETLMAVCEGAKLKKDYSFVWEIDKKMRRMKGISLETFLDKELAKVMVSYKSTYIRYEEFSQFRNDVEVVESGLERDGDLIKFIPKDKLTKEHVLKSIKGGVNFGFIPSECLKDDDVLAALSSQPKRYFEYIPSSRKTYNHYLLAVKNGYSMKSVPTEHHTQEMADFFIKEGDGDVTEVPKEFITKELILEGAKRSSWVFWRFDSPLIDEELAYQLVQITGDLSYSFMIRNQSQRIVDFAINKNPKNIKYAKKEFLSESLVDELLEKDANLINYIPNDFVTEERVYSAVKRGIDFRSDVVVSNQSQRIIDELLERNSFYCESSVYLKPNLREDWIEKVEEKFKTKDFFKKLIKSDVKAILITPKELIDEELCYLLACEGGSLTLGGVEEWQSQRIVNVAFEKNKRTPLRYVKPEFMTTEIIFKAIEGNTENISSVPKSKLSEELAYHFVCNGGNLYNFPNIEQHQSKRVVEKALENNVFNVESVKAEFLTAEVVEDLLSRDKEVIFSLPKEVTTEKMWVEAISDEEVVITKNTIKYIPEMYFTASIVRKLLERDWRLVNYFPKEVLTTELKMIAYEINPLTLMFFDI